MTPIPDDVAVTDLPNGVRYRFPLRQRGPFVWTGLRQLVVGGIGIVFMLFWTGALGAQVLRDGTPVGENGMVLLFLAAGCFMLVMMMWLAAQGVSRLIGHSEIELRGDTLRGYECWGPLRWGWRRSVAGLVRFDVRDAMLEKEAPRLYDTPAAAVQYNVITPVWDDERDHPPEKRRQLGWGYSRDWLVPIAEELARHCRVATAEVSARIIAPAAEIPVLAGPLPNAAGFVEHGEQPANSHFRVETVDGLLRLSFLKELIVEVESDTLRVRQWKTFGVRAYSWSREQLAEVRVGKIVDSHGPDTPLLLIRPHPGEGDLLRLEIHEEADARWLATLLRQRLNLAESDWQEPGSPFYERAELPARCPIVLEQVGDTWLATLPPYGLRDRMARDYAISAAITVALAGAILGLLLWYPQNRLFQALNPTLIYLVLGGVTLLGIVSVVSAAQRGLRHAQLRLTCDFLFCEQSTLFGIERKQFPIEHIADVRVGCHVPRLAASMRQTMVDSGQAPWELHIHRDNGELAGFLHGMRAEELQWLATMLRRELGID
jgi:hypothetical protein